MDLNSDRDLDEVGPLVIYAHTCAVHFTYLAFPGRLVRAEARWDSIGIRQGWYSTSYVGPSRPR